MSSSVVFLAYCALLLSSTAIPEPELLTMAFLSVLLSLLLPVFISILFLPKIVRFFTEQLGHYLRRSSRTRRELLLARVATETEKYKQTETEDYDWKDIASVATGGKGSSSEADKQWDGIVGFFHPFW